MSLVDLGARSVGVGSAWFCCSPPAVPMGGSGIGLPQVMVEEACFSRVIHDKFMVEKS